MFEETLVGSLVGSGTQKRTNAVKRYWKYSFPAFDVDALAVTGHGDGFPDCTVVPFSLTVAWSVVCRAEALCDPVLEQELLVVRGGECSSLIGVNELRCAEHCEHRCQTSHSRLSRSVSDGKCKWKARELVYSNKQVYSISTRRQRPLKSTLRRSNTRVALIRVFEVWINEGLKTLHVRHCDTTFLTSSIEKAIF